MRNESEWKCCLWKLCKVKWCCIATATANTWITFLCLAYMELKLTTTGNWIKLLETHLATETHTHTHIRVHFRLIEIEWKNVHNFATHLPIVRCGAEVVWRVTEILTKYNVTTNSKTLTFNLNIWKSFCNVKRLRREAFRSVDKKKNRSVFNDLRDGGCFPTNAKH